MKQSLKEKLNNMIREKGEVSYGEIAQYIAEEGYKISGGERRLRELMDAPGKEIEAVMGYSRRNTEYIKAYRFAGIKKQQPTYIHEGNKVIMILSK